MKHLSPSGGKRWGQMPCHKQRSPQKLRAMEEAMFCRTILTDKQGLTFDIRKVRKAQITDDTLTQPIHKFLRQKIEIP